MLNSEIFSKKLKDNNIFMEQNKDEDGVYFRIQQTLDYGNNVLVAVIFTNDESIIDINIFNLIKIDDPAKRRELHTLLNEFNKKFRFVKFTDLGGSITAQYSYDIRDHFNPQLAIDYIGLFLNAAEKVYPELIKLQES